MDYPFIDFWHLYAPDKQFFNRYRACERLPWFWLADWQPPQPHWPSPAETGHLLAQRVPLAVCRNTRTGLFGTVTRAEADTFALEVHHYM